METMTKPLAGQERNAQITGRMSPVRMYGESERRMDISYGRMTKARILTARIKRGAGKGRLRKYRIVTELKMVDLLVLSLDERREAKRNGITLDELNRRHQLINSPGYINHTAGNMGSSTGSTTLTEQCRKLQKS